MSVFGNYRAKVVDNKGTMGRVKLFVYGVFSIEFETDADSLPWAEPVEAVSGMTGMIPRNDDIVWVFFEGGDINRPCYFGSCRAGERWLSENTHQHILSTENITITLDEHPDGEKSTKKVDSNNRGCTNTSKNRMKGNIGQKYDKKVRCDINIESTDGMAINLNIVGDVNVKIVGDIYEEHTGNKHLTHTGNVYRRHIGDVHEDITGATIIEREGNLVNIIDGDRMTTQRGEMIDNVSGNVKLKVAGHNDYTLHVGGSGHYAYGNSLDETVNITKQVNVMGSLLTTVKDSIVVRSQSYTQATIPVLPPGRISSYKSDFSGITIV